MKIKLTEQNIRSGEDRAFRLFQMKIAGDGHAWVGKKKAMAYRGIGRAMVRRVYSVARHVEGGKVSPSLGKRGVDTVSLSSVRTAIRKVANGLLTLARTSAPEGQMPDGVLSGAKSELGRASIAGGSLARFIHRSK